LATYQAAGKARDGGNGRKLDYRAIVERHIGNHTGLRHSAKACPVGPAGEGGRLRIRQPARRDRPAP